MIKKITMALDEFNRPVGEHHHRAKLSNADVELIRDIYDEGLCSYSTLAHVFGVSKSTIKDYITFKKRATTPAGYKTVEAHAARIVPKDRLMQLGIDRETLELEDDDWDNNH